MPLISKRQADFRVQRHLHQQSKFQDRQGYTGEPNKKQNFASVCLLTHVCLCTRMHMCVRLWRPEQDTDSLKLQLRYL